MKLHFNLHFNPDIEAGRVKMWGLKSKLKCGHHILTPRLASTRLRWPRLASSVERNKTTPAFQCEIRKRPPRSRGKQRDEWSGHSRQEGKGEERKKQGRKGENWWDSNRGAWVYRRGTIFSNKKFQISGDQVSGTSRAKPRTPISMLRQRDTDTLLRVYNI